LLQHQGLSQVKPPISAVKIGFVCQLKKLHLVTSKLIAGTEAPLATKHLIWATSFVFIKTESWDKLWLKDISVHSVAACAALLD